MQIPAAAGFIMVVIVSKGKKKEKKEHKNIRAKGHKTAEDRGQRYQLIS
jgi:hypothetical protein